ncbi:hypothetical protein CXG81DRAFT_20315 [Caulochytrium protostelioides]|uniref:Transcription initiation factor TFIID subunit 8 n=1 Tax=Caulochytrium protostelioides TaxID=1555241 RepID=A0A4P9X3L4_9FUNG|nr:hypothetical protein CXG81DRAFT_20315 [Caulochytrium protostelioides]|eukprot:RKO99625.1 hypothetical protein CXG81DRAFT_20315 [Caulochytrium protostelioides]
MADHAQPPQDEPRDAVDAAMAAMLTDMGYAAITRNALSATREIFLVHLHELLASMQSLAALSMRSMVNYHDLRMMLRDNDVPLHELKAFTLTQRHSIAAIRHLLAYPLSTAAPSLPTTKADRAHAKRRAVARLNTAAAAAAAAAATTSHPDGGSSGAHAQPPPSAAWEPTWPATPASASPVAAHPRTTPAHAGSPLTPGGLPGGVTPYTPRLDHAGLASLPPALTFTPTPLPRAASVTGAATSTPAAPAAPAATGSSAWTMSPTPTGPHAGYSSSSAAAPAPASAAASHLGGAGTPAATPPTASAASSAAVVAVALTRASRSQIPPDFVDVPFAIAAPGDAARRRDASVPAHLPPFPSAHTYQATPPSPPAPPSAAEARLRQSRQRAVLERNLMRMQGRTAQARGLRRIPVTDFAAPAVLDLDLAVLARMAAAASEAEADAGDASLTDPLAPESRHGSRAVTPPSPPSPSAPAWTGDAAGSEDPSMPSIAGRRADAEDGDAARV